jgi:glycosyltransferase involved in cell wall biosynthesis
MDAGAGNHKHLIYILECFPGDTLNFVYNEIDGLEAAGFTVEIYSLLPSVLCPREARHYLARTKVIRPVPLLRLMRALLYYLFRRPLALLKLLFQLPLDNEGRRLDKAARSLAHLLFGIYFAFLIRKRTSHVHAHFAFKAATAALAAAKLNGHSFSFTAHGGATVHPPRRYHLRSKIRGAGFIVAVSEFNRRTLLELCPDYPHEKVVVNRSGVLLEQFPYRGSSRERAREAAAGGEEPLRLLCVASLRDVKNHEGLITACGLLARRGVDFRLDLVGKDDQDRRSALADLASRRGIVDRVHFHGVVDHGEIASLLEKTDLFVLASHSEGIPVSVMEAMASGIPVLAPRVTGLPELIEEGRTGLLADPARPQEFAELMERALKDPALRREMARRARGHIEAHYDMRANVRALAVIFAERI